MPETEPWQDSEYSSGSEYGRVTQGSQQNLPLSIFDKVLNRVLPLVWNGRVTESCEFCVNCVLKIQGILNMLQVLNIPRFWMY